MIRLGNLKLEDILEDDYIEIVDKLLKENCFQRVDEIDRVKTIEKGYHIFDIPKEIVFSDERVAKEFVDLILENDLNEAFKYQIQISSF